MQILQFSLKDLLCATLLFAGSAALIKDEPIEVGLATLFCALSFSVIGALAIVSLGNLGRQLKLAINNRSLLPLVARIKWIVFDTVIVVWLVALIAITNFILENHVKQSPWLLLIGLLISPFVAHRLTAIYFNNADGKISSDGLPNEKSTSD